MTYNYDANQSRSRQTHAIILFTYILLIIPLVTRTFMLLRYFLYFRPLLMPSALEIYYFMNLTKFHSFCYTADIALYRNIYLNRINISTLALKLYNISRHGSLPFYKILITECRKRINMAQLTLTRHMV